MQILVQRTPRDRDHVGWGVFVSTEDRSFAKFFFVNPAARDYDLVVLREAIRALREIEKSAEYISMRDRLTGRTAGSEPANVGPNPAPSANEERQI